MRSEDKRSLDDWGARVGLTVLRVLFVAALAGLIALGILVRPLPEPPAPTPTRTPAGSPTRWNTGVTATWEAGASGQEEPFASGEASAPPSPTSRPTASPTTEPTPTAVPSATDTAAPTVTPSSTTSSDSVPPTATAPAPSVEMAGRVEEGTWLSQVTGREEDYRIYLPPGYGGQDRRYPVLYLLHGWPYDETHWDNLGVDEVADAMIQEDLLRPFLIVMPGADAGGLYVTTSGGAGSFEEQLVNELMPHVDSTFRSIQRREARAIGGISRGGVWALEIAFRHPDAMGIVGAHSPALSANRAPTPFDPFTLLTEPQVAGLRIYLSTGDADWARPATEELHQALKDEGVDHQFVVHPGTHRDQLWEEHLAEYLAFYAAGW